MSYFIHDTLWAYPSVIQLRKKLTLLTFSFYTSFGRRLTSPRTAVSDVSRKVDSAKGSLNRQRPVTKALKFHKKELFPPLYWNWDASRPVLLVSLTGRLMSRAKLL